MNNNSSSRSGPFTAFVDPSFKNRSWDSPSSSPKHVTKLADSTQLEEVFKTGDDKQVKALLRLNHWPPQHEIRGKLWRRICQSQRKPESSLYKEMVTDMFGTEKQVHASLPAFVDPSSMHQYHLSDHGVKAAKKVMCIIGKSRPDVIYAPTLYTLSCLLLHYMEEQEAFDVLEWLLTAKSKHLLQTKVSYEASVFVLKELVKKYTKKLFSYLIQQNIKPEHVLSDWTWWIFRDLPFSHLVCIVDCYLYEGPKILYRVVLAILKLFYENKLKNPTAKLDSSLNIAISQFCQDMPGISVDHLLRVAFKIRGFSRKEIQKQVIKQEMYVTSLINTHGLQTTNMTKSPSCESLNDNVTVSRSFSLQEIGSSLLTAENWNTIWGWIPDRVRLLSPELIFSTSEHGTSLSTFYQQVEDRENCPASLLVIKTTTNKLIGAYCSADWVDRRKGKKALAYFGTGETFVFNLESSPIASTTTSSTANSSTAEGSCKYQWVGVNLREETPSTAQLFMSGDNTVIQIGGGGGGAAIRLDDDLNKGETRNCLTFDNPPLGGEEYFECITVEVFGFK